MGLSIGHLVSSLPNTITGPPEALDRGLALHSGTLTDNSYEDAVELGDGAYLLSDVHDFTVGNPVGTTGLTVAGRPSLRLGFENPSDGVSACQVETVQAPFKDGLVEIAEIAVLDRPGQQDHTCLLATDLAVSPGRNSRPRRNSRSVPVVRREVLVGLLDLVVGRRLGDDP